MSKTSFDTVDLQTNEEENQKHKSSKKSKSVPAFNHGASKYKTFFGLLHVAAAANAFAIITFFLIGSPILNCASLIFERPLIGSFWLLSWFLWLPLIICTWSGVSSKNRYLLLPYIIYNIIFAIAAVIIFIVYILLKYGGSEDIKNEMKNMDSKIVKVMSNHFAQFLLNLILGWKTYDCYVYFRDLDNYTGTKHIGYFP